MVGAANVSAVHLLVMFVSYVEGLRGSISNGADLHSQNILRADISFLLFVEAGS